MTTSGGEELTPGSWRSGSASRGERLSTRTDDLSGGERRRLQLLRLLLTEPNVLLLDEPTNDLDIETLTALEDVLDGWPGTLIVVTHDRYFARAGLRRPVRALATGGLRHLPGGVDQYLELRGEATAVPAASTSRAAAPPSERAEPGRPAPGGAEGARAGGA